MELSGNNAPPVRSREFDLQRVTLLAIDQVVVDGVVDGLSRRAPMNMLVGIAFGGNRRVPEGVFYDFRDALRDDQRYIDHVQSEYGYQPVLLGPTEARPSLQYIVGGTAMCTEAEHQRAMDLMDRVATKAIEACSTTDGVVFPSELRRILRTSGIFLNHQEYGALKMYMDKDPRFKPLGDGRVVFLEHFQGDAKWLEEAAKVDDLAGLVTDALPFVRTGQDRSFKFGTIMGAIKARGTRVRNDQTSDLLRVLSSHPNILRVSAQEYKIIGDIEDNSDTLSAGREYNYSRDLVVPTENLDSMIRGALKGSSASKLPYSRRKGGKRPRSKEM